jgi:hypothetical protein
MRFFPKGSNPFKIQERFKFDLILEFIIQMQKDFEVRPKRKGVPYVPNYHFDLQSLINFGHREGPHVCRPKRLLTTLSSYCVHGSVTQRRSPSVTRGERHQLLTNGRPGGLIPRMWAQ